jgi:hypothetical protein
VPDDEYGTCSKSEDTILEKNCHLITCGKLLPLQVSRCRSVVAVETSVIQEQRFWSLLGIVTLKKFFVDSRHSAECICQDNHAAATINFTVCLQSHCVFMTNSVMQTSYDVVKTKSKEKICILGAKTLVLKHRFALPQDQTKFT